MFTSCVARMDGFQATRAIRDLHNGKDVPIIGLTAGYVKDNAHLYEEAGMSECIAKPFRMHELQRVIQQHVLKEDPASPLIK
jgi:CheY-like chemotaxis protein